MVESYFEYNKTGDESFLEGFMYSGLLNKLEKDGVSVNQIFECTYADYMIKSIRIEEKLIAEEARQYLYDLGYDSSVRSILGTEAELLDHIELDKIEAVLLCAVNYRCDEEPNADRYYKPTFRIIAVTQEEAYPVLENHAFWSATWSETQEQ